MPIKVIGLTGNSGSGKGYISELLKEYGIRSVDTDALVHRLYQNNGECKDELRKNFGDSVFDSEDNIDRKKLAQIVFSDHFKLSLLNKIVHKYVIKQCDIEISKADKRLERAIVIDAPQLFEAGMDETCDIIIAAVADENVRIKRIVERDRISYSDACIRIKNQHLNEFYRKNADYIIENNGPSDVRGQLEDILKKECLI